MVLSSETIHSYLAGTSFASQRMPAIVVLEEIGSTNDWALERCKQGGTLPFVCYAEKQTRGRGRRGKRWSQAENANIAMSIALRAHFKRDAIAHLPMAVAMSVVSSLEQMGVKDCQIKWPNDVLVAGEKIAGILIETVSLPKDESVDNDPNETNWAIIIGIGFNYDMTDLIGDELMNVPWTDLLSILGGPALQGEQGLNRNEVAAILLKNCLEFCLVYPDNVASLCASYTRYYDYCRGKQVELLLNDGKTVQGLATGLSDRAELIVQVAGVEQMFHSADVSIRPLEK